MIENWYFLPMYRKEIMPFRVVLIEQVARGMNEVDKSRMQEFGF